MTSTAPAGSSSPHHLSMLRDPLVNQTPDNKRYSTKRDERAARATPLAASALRERRESGIPRLKVRGTHHLTHTFASLQQRRDAPDVAQKISSFMQESQRRKEQAKENRILSRSVKKTPKASRTGTYTTRSLRRERTAAPVGPLSPLSPFALLSPSEAILAKSKAARRKDFMKVAPHFADPTFSPDFGARMAAVMLLTPPPARIVKSSDKENQYRA